ncbi:MAG: restriction endonuclease subunit S [Desulfamplus sp.]
MSNILKINIADIGETITGKTPSSNFPEDFGNKYMFVTPTDDFNNKVISNTERYLSEFGISKLKNKALEPFSVMVTCIGSAMGKVAMNKTLCVTNQQINSIRINRNKYNQDYIYYVLRNNYKKLRNASTGSTALPLLNKTDFDLIELDIHSDIKYQQKIAAVLSSLDAKIELNNRINAELEAMAKTLYDYWFVQFNFPDKNGKPYKSSGGKMVWNAELKREIPEGWEIESIEQCCDIVDCLHSKKPDYTYEDENSYLLQLENLLDNGLIDISNKYYVSTADYKTWISRIEVKENDILITNAGRVAATVQVSKEIVSGIGRNITAIRPLTVKPTYLFLSFRGIDMLRQIKWNTDSGAFFSSFNVKGIKKLYILKPASFIEKQFEIIAYSFRRKRELIQVENSFLCQLRDFLLPMLMNGQVKVV